MSYYTEQISTKIIDPNVYVENLRVEFQIPAGDYGNRWRLQGVGLTTAGAGVIYNRNVGAWSTIKSVRLLNGRDELDACREANRYLAFKSFNRKNANNMSVSSVYNQGGEGLELGQFVVGGGSRAAIGKTNPVSQTLTNDPATTPLAYLDLRECLPILKSMEVFPRDMFPQLRIVIEYESDMKAMVSNTSDAVKTTRPTLSVDVMEDEGLVNAMSSEIDGVSWDAVEHDLFRIPQPSAAALAAGAEQKNSARLNGFNNKRLSRIAFCKVASDPRNYVSAAGAVVSGGSLCSDAFIKEKLQVRVNNKPKLARNGANGRNQRLSLLVDSHGDCSTYYGSNMVSPLKFSERVSASTARQGGEDYYGMKVNEIVKDLQVELTRDTYASTKNNNEIAPELKAYNVHCFGEVRKQMVAKGNSYQIIYA